MNTINKIAARFILSVAAMAITATASLAAPITIPTGLNPGDQYRIAFVTSTTRTALSSDIADYNAFVTAAANSVAGLASLGTTWSAIGSTATVNARDNTNTNFTISTGVGIYLLNDTKLADDNADLWDGSLQNSLSIDETGATTTPINGLNDVFTGTDQSGIAITNLVLGGGGNAVTGAAFGTGQNWIDFDTNFNDGNNLQFYGISGILTVASEETSVSEPGALTLMAVGLVGLGVIRRRRGNAGCRGLHLNR